MRYIPEGIQKDPLNYRTGKCIVLAGLPQDVTKFYLTGYLMQIISRLKLTNVTRSSANIGDTSKWLIFLNNIEDTYFLFSRIHNRYFEDNIFYQMKARIVR